MGKGEDLVAGAKAARKEGEIDRAALLYRQAAEHARQHGDLLACAHRLRHAGDLRQEAGENDDAAALYAEALTLYRDHPATSALDLANLLRPFALLKENAGARAEAAALWAEAKALYGEAGVEAGVLESEGRLARLS